MIKKLIRFIPILFCAALNAQQSAGYFQQEVNYVINVMLDDSLHMLRANEKIEYINNSPDQLSFIYFHLWPNAYKNNTTALAKQQRENGKLFMHFAKDEDLGWIDSLDFKVNGESISWEYDAENPDICKLNLNAPLKPGAKIEITTPFRVKLPSALISRLGHIGQAYCVTQWYPKPAVYDINGWNPMPYLDQGEFYSEWGSFDVSITIPKNYVVGATGDLENGKEETKFLNQRVKQTFNKMDMRSKLRAARGGVLIDSMGFPQSAKEYKTLRYKQKNVHDFAWFADKRFNVLKGEVTLPKSKRTVTCWAMFTDNNFELWMRSIEYLSDATFFYSLWNGDYQYNHVTAIDGTISAGGGMEYPNITVIGEASGDFDLENVIMHEVGHNWFYGMLGTNERKHAWMDEGLNSFNELRYMRNKYPAARAGAMFGIDSTGTVLGVNNFENAYQYYFLYAKAARENRDQPIEQHSALFTEANYGAIVYSKTAIVFDYLFHYMGEQKFDEAMHFYFDHYHFTHPYPSDLRKTMEYFSGKDLSWCFDDLIGTTKKLDYKIIDFRKASGGNYEVLVRNTGDIKAPVLIGGLKNGKLKGVVWYDGFEGEKWLGFPTTEIDLFMIDPWYCMPEINRHNNRMKLEGSFKKVEPLQVGFIALLENPAKTQFFYSPVFGYNEYNGFMAGLYLHNAFEYEKKFEFDLAPMFALRNNQIAGLADFKLHFHPEKTFQSITAGLGLKRFSYANIPFDQNYNRAENYYVFELKKNNPRSKIINKISVNLIYAGLESYQINTGFVPQFEPTGYERIYKTRTFGELHFNHTNKRTLHPYSFKLSLQTGSEDFLQKGAFAKAWGEFKYHLTINKKNNGFDFRLFAGAMTTTGTNTIDARFRLGGIKGYQDYSFEYLYFGRTTDKGINAQIYVEEDGAFKTRMFAGQSNRFIAALNIKSPRVLKTFGLFADFGTCGSDGLVDQNDYLFYDFGVNIDIFKDALNIYIPVGYSKNISDGIAANGWNFVQRVMINVRLDRMYPKRYLNEIISF